MTTEAAEFITEVANYGDHEFKHHKNYSGRGMFGEHTSGVVCDSLVEFLNVVAHIIVTEEEDSVRMVAEAITDISTDSMGKNIIIY